MRQGEGVGGLGRFAEPAVLVLVSLAGGPKHARQMRQRSVERPVLITFMQALS